MQDDVLSEALKETEIFKDYTSNFKTVSLNKSLQKELFEKSSYYREGLKERSKEYRTLFGTFLESEDYKNKEKSEYERQFIAFAKEIECRKLNVYIQTYNNNVAILQSPQEKKDGKSNKAEVIKFLGYDWSKRKGDEGIKYLTNNVQETESLEDDDDKDVEIVQAINSIKYIETPLYNPNDSEDVTKFSYALRKHITDCCSKFSFGTAKANSETPFVGEMASLLQFTRLTNLIEFGKTTFNLSVRTFVGEKREKVLYKEGVEVKKLDIVADVRIGGTPSRNNYAYFEGNNLWVSIAEMNGTTINDTKEKISDDGVRASNVKLIPKGTTLLSFKLSIGKTAIAGKDLYTNEAIAGLIPKDDSVSNEYLFHLFSSRMIDLENVDYKAFGKSLNSTYLKEQIMIPLPSKIIQQKIVTECQKIDAEAQKSKEKIADLQEDINEIVADIKGRITKLGSIALFKNGLNYKESPAGDTISIVGVADFKDNKSPKWDDVKNITIKENVDDSYLLHKNDLLTVRSNGSRELVGRFMLIEKEPEKRTTFSGFSIRVRIVSDEVDSEFLYYLLSSENVRQHLTTGSNGANIKSLNQELLSNLEITLPSLSEQKKVVDKIGAIENEIATLKAICNGAATRKKAVLHRELIEDD